MDRPATRPSPTRRRVRLAVTALALLWAAVAGPPVVASEGGRPDRWRLKAVEHEKRGAWLDACRCYEEMLRKDRHSPAAREGYARCYRRCQLVGRHADPLHRHLLARLNLPQALDAYEQVLATVTAAHPDRSRTTCAALFQQGLLELRLALDDPQFRQLYLAGVKPAAIQAYRDRLAAWPARRTLSRGEARDQAMLAIRSAPRDGLPLRPLAACAFALELAAGACAALDEYSAFLTPGQFAQAGVRGRVAGVGLDLGVVEDRLQVVRVHGKGPAHDAGVARGDRVTRIAGIAVEDSPAEAAADRLRGEPGTPVDVEFVRPAEGGVRRSVRLVRRAVVAPSVEARLFALDDGSPVGYLNIQQFQDSTLAEVQEALASMVGMGDPVKGLILDLRGNPGGLFKSAVAVAELFVSDGILAIGQSPLREYNRPFRAETGGPVQLPLVVLIDGETASAAEVLAAALKEARSGRFPTRLIGQTSYGKGTIQCVIPIDKPPLDSLAGVRLTVARLLSPTSQPISGRGVTPHVISDRDGDLLLLEARKHLLELIGPAMSRPMEIMGGAS